MANKSLQNERTDKTILAGSNQATSKYGFAGNSQSAITAAPKMGDMWFVEFIDTITGLSSGMSSFAKSISPITISTETVSIDKYGKRVHIPVYVNFPEISISLYDKTDGSGFAVANELYSNFFKNANLGTDAGVLDSTIRDRNSGRGFPSNAEDTGYYRSFKKIVIYHFFGSFGQGIDRDPRGREQLGEVDAASNGSIQKIEIINPLLTSISFSGSDYADSSLRTIDLQLQPENIIFGIPQNNVVVPDWMKQGLEFILEDLDPSNSVDNAAKLLSNIRTNKKLDSMISGLASGKNLGQIDNEFNGLDQIANNNEVFGVSSDTNAREQLSRLKRLSGTLQYVKTNPDATEEEKAEAQKLFAEEIATAIPMPASSLKQYDDFGEMRNSLNSQNRFPDNPYSSDILYPNVAGFPNARLVNGGTDRFTGIDLANLISNELITSFLNGRSINLDNITSPIAQGILGGNTGIGNIQTTLETSQSRFGLGGDIIRDSLLKSTRLGNNTTGPRTTVVSTAPTFSAPVSDYSDKDLRAPGTQFDSKSRNATQNSITNLRNRTGGSR
jgi:hypothetical protein